MNGYILREYEIRIVSIRTRRSAGEIKGDRAKCDRIPRDRIKVAAAATASAARHIRPRPGGIIVVAHPTFVPPYPVLSFATFAHRCSGVIDCVISQRYSSVSPAASCGHARDEEHPVFPGCAR